jgi:hypothetical protein
MMMGNAQGGLAAVLFLGAGTNVYDAFSAVMSSPWSTQKFSEDEEADAMAREYVMHGLAISMAYAVAAAIMARSMWPLIGAIGIAAYMYWLYDRALKRAGEKRISPAEAWTETAPIWAAGMVA